MPSRSSTLLEAAHALRRPLALFLAQRLRVVAGSACTVLAALALLQLPGIAGDALDVMRTDGDGDLAATAAARAALLDLGRAFVGFAVAEAVLRYLGRRWLITASRRAERRLVEQVFEHLTRVRIPALERFGSGELVSRSTQDVELLRFATGPTLLYGLQAAVVAPGGVAVLVAASPPLAVASGLVFAALGVALWRVAPSIQRTAADVQQRLGDLSDRGHRTLAALRLIRGARREAAEADRAIDRHRDLGTAKIALAGTRARADLAIHASVQALLLAGLALGGLEVLAGRATPGDLLHLYALLGVALQPLLAVGFVIGAAPRAVAAGRRVEEIFALPTERATGRRPRPRAPRIEVRGLRIAGNSGGADRLVDVSFEVAPGERIGVVGPTGSGKSTLLDALDGFVETPSGVVHIDGQDAQDLAPADVRAAFARVAQEPFLFAGTLADNVRLGRPDASDAEVAAACRLAVLDRDLDGFPERLDTRVGEGGRTLSGGQRQRVALARALCSARPVLLLDDALSAVDVHTARAILAGLADRDGSAILVSHRLPALAMVDRILEFDAGRLVRSGTPGELARGDGFFARGLRSQREAGALERETPP